MSGALIEPGAARDQLLFLDAPSGVSGDMLVAALLDLGVPPAVLESGLATLPVAGYRIEHGSVERSGITARRFIVDVHEPQPERTYGEIATMLDAADLPPGAARIAAATFRLLAEAEGAVHGVAPEHVHFHEVGAVDSIVDIVGAALLLDHLGATVTCSPLPMGHGRVMARHGALPLPAPATVECLRGIPTYEAGVEGELVTPTGAALVGAVARRFERWPSFVPRATGWGAGTRELPDRPNVLRAVLGDPYAAGQTTDMVVIETNVDDTSAEVAAYALDRVREAGAHDAWTQPIGMKKGRPGWMLSVLADARESERIAHLLAAETGSLGVRLVPIRRVARPRHIVQVGTAFGVIRVKVAEGDGIAPTAAPEFEDCREAAVAHGVPLRDVYRAALLALETAREG